MTDDTGRQAATALEQGYHAALNDIEDFWGRRAGLPLQTSAQLFGRTVELRASHACFVDALELATPAYSTAAMMPAPALVVEAVVADSSTDPGAVPDDLAVSYTGRNDWIDIDAGAFGHASADLTHGLARIVIHPRLAQRVDVLRARLLDTVLLNLLTASGLGMLHASCLVHADSAVLVLGDHGTGKTTTSLRAIESDQFQLLTDSMVFVDNMDGSTVLHGFPVGRMKLRQDVAAAFVERQPAAPALVPECVRGETKHVLDLAAWAPDRVHAAALSPARTCLCLLQRQGAAATTVRPADASNVVAAVITNSLFFDTAPGWRHNLEQLQLLLAGARCVHLSAGTDPDGLVQVLQQLAR